MTELVEQLMAVLLLNSDKTIDAFCSQTLVCSNFSWGDLKLPLKKMRFHI